jgi:signal transduction histidine kinase
MNSSDIDFKGLFESIPGLYLVLSPEFRILAASDVYLKATLTERSKIIDQEIFDVFPDNPEDPSASGVENLKTSLQRVLETRLPDTMAVQQYDIQRPESEGGGFEERYWSPLNTPVLGKDNKVQYIIHRAEDVTEFIKLKQQGTEQSKLTETLKSKASKMEREIFTRAQEIQEANKKLLEAEKVKSEFFANVSHELRTPLSLILSPLESILSEKYGSISEQQRNYLYTIYNNAMRLLQMVNGLLDFSKFEAGKMEVHREPTELTGIIKLILNDFESMMRGNHIDLFCEIEFGDQYVMMDRYLFERILFNLVSNAAKFTPEGGKVMVRASQTGDILTVSVEDNGIGIPESAIKNLFQKFRQVEGSSTRRFEGTGLGLAMVKEFTELLDGTVSVTSEEGKGSTFTVQCLAPVTTLAPRTTRAVAERKTLVLRYQKTGFLQSIESGASREGLMKVLICEDNEELSAYIVSVLQEICQTKTANNGEQAMEFVHTWQPDLVLSDVMMPKKDGLTVCREIKSNPKTSHIVVVLLTALTHREAMLKGWEAKANEYLFKPFHPEELLTRIKSLLSSIQERKDANLLLEQRNAELTRLNASLEAFSYSVSHDLRAPLRSIEGYSRVLLEDHADILPHDGKHALNVIINNSQKMNNLIEDMLQFSKLDRKELNKTVVDIDAIVKSVLDEIKGDTTKTEIKIGPLLAARADNALITQVWMNLLSNAVKYSSRKEKPVVEIGSSKNDGEIIYFVKDNGTGFDMKYADKLFGVFQRLHKPEEFKGTGIGLALVKRIVNKHNGRIWAEARPNEGATFYFTLPIQE